MRQITDIDTAAWWQTGCLSTCEKPWPEPARWIFRAGAVLAAFIAFVDVLV